MGRLEVRVEMRAWARMRMSVGVKSEGGDEGDDEGGCEV